MTPDQQRIAIATACGWKVLEPEVKPAITYPWGLRKGFIHEENREIIPDYLNDRNAMHNAIITKFVTIELQQKFAMQLRSLIKKAPPFASRSWSDWDLIAASLPQLSEAFLCTLGLWEEDAQ